jgi:UDP-N-acetylglucosamine 4,6-dehydratase/5-epimerase
MKRHTTPFVSLPAPVKLVGLRPGEKLHEVMCPLDDLHLTLEFESSFVIRPSIAFFDGSVDYSVSGDGQYGHATPDGFEYRSDSNRHFLSVTEIAQLNSAVTNEIT